MLLLEESFKLFFYEKKKLVAMKIWKMLNDFSNFPLWVDDEYYDVL